MSKKKDICDFIILDIIDNCPGISPGEIVKQLCIHRHTIRHLLLHLKIKNLVWDTGTSNNKLRKVDHNLHPVCSNHNYCYVTKTGYWLLIKIKILMFVLYPKTHDEIISIDNHYQKKAELALQELESLDFIFRTYNDFMITEKGFLFLMNSLCGYVRDDEIDKALTVNADTLNLLLSHPQITIYQFDSVNSLRVLYSSDIIEIIGMCAAITEKGRNALNHSI
jgi:hypothetical protein